MDGNPLQSKFSQIDWSLYAIVDKEGLGGRTVEEFAVQVLRGGAGVLQYRNKVSESREFYTEAQRLREVSRRFCVPFIVNDRVDIALGVDADGFHLGKEDVPLDVARKLMGRRKIIGVSVQCLLDVQTIGEADYLGVGAIYRTETHRNYAIAGIETLARIRRETRLPIVGIGGITLQNALSVIQAGADGVAVISALMNCSDPETEARQFVEKIKHAKFKEVQTRGLSKDDYGFT